MIRGTTFITTYGSGVFDTKFLQMSSAGPERKRARETRYLSDMVMEGWWPRREQAIWEWHGDYMDRFSPELRTSLEPDIAKSEHALDVVMLLALALWPDDPARSAAASSYARPEQLSRAYHLWSRSHGWQGITSDYRIPYCRNEVECALLLADLEGDSEAFQALAERFPSAERFVWSRGFAGRPY